jgi:hypothetical protein
MKLNNTAIYNCEYAGWEKQDWGYYTKKRDQKKVYMIVFNVPVSGSLRIKPARNMLVDKAYFLSSPQKQLSLEKLDNGASFIHLPKTISVKQPFVIVLETKEGKQGSQGEKAKT